MLRVRRVWESALVRIERIDHPNDAPHVDPEEEISGQYSINLLERGSFSIRHGARTWTVGPTELFVTVPGQVDRYLHDDRDEAPTDVCLAVCFNDAVRDEVGGPLGSLQHHAPVVAIDNRRAYLRQRLFDHLAVATDSMALDAVSAELLAASLGNATGRLYRPGQLSWYARRIDAARRTLDDDFGSDHTLSQLARDAGMSPYHFARVFRELTGLPPHRYLLRRRLSAAAQQLRGGASVTDTCFAVGFRSLSHFIHVFRRRFGVPPSRLV